MEQNTDRMGFALIALSIVAVVLIIMNTIFLPTIKSYFQGLQKWSDNVMNQLNPPQQYTHTAYSWSADGKDRFTTTKPNLNLLDGTSRPFIMVYGIPTTTWDATNQVSGISLPLRATATEVLPQDPGFRYWYIPGVTYTQSIYIKTDAPLTGTHIYFTWFTDQYGHDSSGVDNLVKVSENVYRATSTYTWPSSKTSGVGRNADLGNLTQVFDFTKGTFLKFYKPKLEQGSTATPWMPSQSEATAADGPKYIGTYTDKNESASQDPSKYTWKLNPDYHE